MAENKNWGNKQKYQDGAKVVDLVNLIFDQLINCNVSAILF